MRRSVSYFDLAARATADLDREALRRAIERLSRSYREGKAIAHERSLVDRAAYVIHVMPAHVCDERRLVLEELPDLLEGDALDVVALGGGPGTEVLALAEAVAQARAAGEGAPSRVRVVRVDRVGAWDDQLARLLPEFTTTARDVEPGLGETWTVEAPPTLAVDLIATPLAVSVLDAARRANVVLAANLVTELPPRGTDAPPAGFLENLAAIARAAPAGASVVIVDRALAPGAAARVDACLRAVVAARPGTLVEGPTTRETRCKCALTRATKELYAGVRLETTKVEDKPVLNTRTIWARARLGAAP